MAKGDQVVVLLSGHGSQQPDNDPDNPEDPEPDGLDEIFCPADLKDEIEIVDGAVTIPNALTDDELRELLGEIRKRGAFVWIIVDACHSGSAVRGTEVYRQLDAERLIPAQYLREAKAKARSAARGAHQQSQGMNLTDETGGLVAIYAAQPHEPTIEMPLPPDSVYARWRGLLSFTLVQVLLQSSTDLTYKQLVQRIHARYIQEQGRLGPTPLIEGDRLDQFVLRSSSTGDRCPFVLFPAEDGRLKVSGGQLHGLAEGTVLAVHPPAGSPNPKKIVGHVAVQSATVVDAFVEPVAVENRPVNTKLPIGGRCRPLQVEYGQLALNVAITGESESKKDQGALKSQVHASIVSRRQPVRIIDSVADADWLVKMDQDGVRLLPAGGWSDDVQSVSRAYGPHPINEELVDWIGSHLGNIARVHGLLKICGTSQQERSRNWLSDLVGNRTCDVELTFSLIDSSTQELTPIDWSHGGTTLADGDLAALQITNSGTEAIDFSVLFIDSQFGITPLYPAPGMVADNRLDPDASFTVGPLQVEGDSLGIEHLVVIASQAQGQPADFTWLAQKQLENRSEKRGAGDSPAGPLQQLLETALFSAPQTRGIRLKRNEDVAMQAVSWRTVRNKPDLPTESLPD